jgi:DNA replication protein DnaC
LAAQTGYSVRFYSTPLLINRLKELKVHKNLPSIQKQFEKTDLLILDELGYISFDKETNYEMSTPKIKKV